jgi:hypothetical protein
MSENPCHREGMSGRVCHSTRWFCFGVAREGERVRDTLHFTRTDNAASGRG